MDFLFKVVGGSENDENSRIKIPDELICTGSIVTAVYGEAVSSSDTTAMSSKAIFTLRNRSVDQLNVEVLTGMSGKVYKSIDVALSKDTSDAIEFQQEFLHKLDPPGMPPHDL
ncbi:hypothetical protein OESDEN_13543 [Oesophagostomum dentatum]|uniref:Uncharacterized protein n=1 Tax=Oesophagostomum dentatum TaxID=61180 RepID=A0A0B1SP44_OESDE|nr:hypothetical protein OESDEN_13543 [Oesophagostomum dentatum]